MRLARLEDAGPIPPRATALEGAEHEVAAA
jgi:hypothetical protein